MPQPLKFTKAFTNGLRSTWRGVDQDRLSLCYNGKPYPEGLRGWEEVPQVVVQSEVKFPFPQLFVGRYYTLLAFEDSVYSYNVQTGVKTLFSVVDANTGLASSINDFGGVWNFTDLGKAFMLVNESNILFVDASDFDSVEYASPQIKHTDSVTINTMCEWHGVVFSAGFNPKSTFKSEWTTMMSNIRTAERTPDDFRELKYDLEKSHVLWSSAGTSDFSFRWLVYPDEATTGLATEYDSVDLAYSGTDETPLQETILRMDFGGMPLEDGDHSIGEILRLVPHAKGVIAYGTNGIYVLLHVLDPFPTFTKKLLSETGIPCKGAVAGDDSTHCFVDTNGRLSILDGELKIVPLGYEEFFKSMLTKDIMVAHKPDSHDPEFYISSSDRGFCLTKNGLGEQYQRIISVAVVDGTAICTSRNSSDTGLNVELGDIAIGTSGLKQIQTLRVMTNRSNGVYGYSQLAYNLKPEHYVMTRPRLFNPSGALICNDSGVLFKPGLSVPEPSGLIIHSLELEYTEVDKRARRTRYAEDA